jgi:hypothetical protein
MTCNAWTPLTVSTLHANPEVVVGGLVVSVLSTGPKVRGFKPGRGRWNFYDDKIPQHAFLPPSAAFREILRHVKEPFEAWNGYFVKKSSLTSPVPPALVLIWLDKIAKGLWRKNQFSPADVIPPWSSMLISLGGWWPQFRDAVWPHHHDPHQYRRPRGLGQRTPTRKFCISSLLWHYFLSLTLCIAVSTCP